MRISLLLIKIHKITKNKNNKKVWRWGMSNTEQPKEVKGSSENINITMCCVYLMRWLKTGPGVRGRMKSSVILIALMA